MFDYKHIKEEPHVHKELLKQENKKTETKEVIPKKIIKESKKKS